MPTLSSEMERVGTVHVALIVLTAAFCLALHLWAKRQAQADKLMQRQERERARARQKQA